MSSYRVFFMVFSFMNLVCLCCVCFFQLKRFINILVILTLGFLFPHSPHIFCASSSREVPYLPDELLLNCLARVSRSYYPSLSLVSKRFRSLLASKELYKTRTLLGTTESCLYLTFYFYGSLFTLCRRPTRPIVSYLLSSSFCRPWNWKNLLVSVPTRKLLPPHTIWGDPTLVGSYIYMIGGSIKRKHSSRVFVLDCRFHTWHEAPSMRIARKLPLVTVIGEIIYVMERSSYGNSQHMVEFFDTKTQIWETLPIPEAEIRGTHITNSLANNGNLYLFGDKNVVYKPKENKWDAVGSDVAASLLAVESSTCVVDNVKYSYHDGHVKWWDSKVRLWRPLKGCEDLRNLEEIKFYAFGELVKYGENIAVFWEKNVFTFSSEKKKKIWCAEITLEKRTDGQEIRGKVSRRGVVLTVPKSSILRQYIVTTI